MLNHPAYRQVRLRFVLAIAIASASFAAHAETRPAELEILRVSGSEHCPDVDAVYRAVKRLFPASPGNATPDLTHALGSATITIRPTSMGHEALIRVAPPRDGERIIVDNDVQCEGLADALAVALVMLFEPSVDAANPPSVAATVKPTISELRQSEPPKSPALTHNPATIPLAPKPLIRVGGQVGAMGGIGLFSTPSAGVELGFSVSHRWGLRFDLAAIRLVAAPAKRGPGDVELDVWGGLGGACYGRKLSTTTLLEGCLVYGAGSLRGESKGYVRNGMSRRLWMVLGPKIQLNFPLSAWLSGFVGLGALGHLTRQAFSIQDVGIVANAPSAAILLQAGLRVEPLGF